MTGDRPTPTDDEFTARLAALDEALAGGGTPAGLAGDTPSELRHRLHRGLAALRVLHDLRPPDAVQPPVGRGPARIGRFAIDRELGRGGFGVVFLAHDPALHRDVALKVPHAHALVDDTLRARFRREAEAAAALDHPNVVPVHEVGEAGPVCYIASAYCPGPTLAAWLSRAPAVPVADAAGLVATLADAVHHAHDRGVVHRDLKPGNILLCRNPKLQIPNPNRTGNRVGIWNLGFVISHRG